MTLNQSEWDEKERLLYEIYTDISNPASFSSPWKLFKAIRSRGHRDVTLLDVERFLEGQRSYTLHRHFNPKFKRRKVLARGVGYQYQADLIDYAPLKRENKGLTFLLSVIDVFSCYALLIPLKSKHGETVRDGLVRVFEHMRLPVKFQTDKGKEFYNRHVCELLQKNTVHHFSTEQDVKAQIVEHFNRTVREVMKRYMTHVRSLKYIDIIPDFLERYNNRPHSSIYPYAPSSVNKDNEKVVHELQYGEYLKERKRHHKFSIGDHVRISQYRGTFRKSYRDKNFTEEIFEVVDKLFTNPPMYCLKDLNGELIEGSFYERELQRVSKRSYAE